MKNIIFKIISVAILLLLPNTLIAQFPGGFGWVFPRVSPAAKIFQTVGVTEITIKYHRPAVKQRTIWGCQTKDILPNPSVNYKCLAPNNQIWRAGANDATTISFTTDVKIENQSLAAGTYALFMIPNQKEWTIIFSKRDKQWGAFTYKESEDALRVKVAPETAEHIERLQYSFPKTTNDSAQIELHWDKLRVTFKVKVDTEAQSLVKASTTFHWTSGWFAAGYLHLLGQFVTCVKLSYAVRVNS